VTNFGTIKGGLGCISLSSGTVINAGILSASTPTGTAIQFGTGVSKLVEQTGAAIAGKIAGGGGTTLELANGGAGTNVGATISGIGGIIVDPGVTWTVAVAETVANVHQQRNRRHCERRQPSMSPRPWIRRARG
jgi:hypothetical protein